MKDSPPYDPRIIANELIELGREYGLSVTHLTLQKAVYFLHERYLKVADAPLCSGHFEAWKHGPVHPQLWTSFKAHGAEKIEVLATKLDVLTGEICPLPRISENRTRRFIVTEGLALLEMPAARLVGLSHSRGGPWDVVTHRHGGKREYGGRISNEVIVQSKNGRMIPIRPHESFDEVLYEHPPS